MADGITDANDMNLGKLWEMVKGLETWRAAVHGVTKNRTQLRDYTATLNYLQYPKEHRQTKVLKFL